MKATVIYLLDDTVVEDVHEGDRIIVKIHHDGRGYVRNGTTLTLYRQVEKIIREDA